MSRYPNWVSMCLNQHTHTHTQRLANTHSECATFYCILRRAPELSLLPYPILCSQFSIPFPLSISCQKLLPSQDATCLELLRWKSTQVQAENINQKPWQTENFIVNDKREARGSWGCGPLPDKSLVNFLGHCLQQALNCLAASQDDAAGGQEQRQALEEESDGGRAGNPLS